MWDLLAPGGIFIVNVKDHIRKGVKQPVSAWHRLLLIAIGFELLESRDMPVRGNRQGRNGDVRVDHAARIARMLAATPATCAARWSGSNGSSSSRRIPMTTAARPRYVGADVRKTRM